MEASYPPLGDRIDLGADFAGQKIHVFQAGPRTAPPVVLIHGASGNLRDFTFGFIDRISDRFRVIAIDRPGFGYSERGDGNAHLPDNQAAAMRAAAEALGVNRAIIAGHSLGSASALSWALDAPETVAGVLVLGGVSHPWKGTAGHVYDVGSVPGVGHMLAGAVAAFVSERRAKSGIEAIFRPQAAPDGYADYVGVALALRAATFRYNNLDIGLLKPYLKRRSPEYANLATPIEIVHGALDTIVPPDVHSIPLSQKAPNARLNLLEGVGHMPHHVAPEACEAALDRLSASF
ncbi:MAG: alpha/beta fold hydrolase [Neomegalonema sp.]